MENFARFSFLFLSNNEMPTHKKFIKLLGLLLRNVVLDILIIVNGLILYLMYYIIFSIFLGGKLTILFSILLSLFTMFGLIYIALTPFGEKFLTFKFKLRKLLPDEEAIVKNEVSEVFEKSNLSGKVDLYISPDSDLNAFAFGTKSVAITKGLLYALISDKKIGEDHQIYKYFSGTEGQVNQNFLNINVTSEEFKAIVAHEVGHIINGDTVFSLVASVADAVGTFAATVITTFALIISHIAYFGSDDSSRPFAFVLVIFAWGLKAISWLLKQFLLIEHMVVSRAQEFAADYYAGALGYREHLISFLRKIEHLDSKKETLLSLAMRSHPPTSKRIENLLNS
ncbi:MAG: M48 family metalloprotease [Nitrososphaeria archaeon]